MKQTGKHRVIVINLLVALALTLIVNFSFLRELNAFERELCLCLNCCTCLRSI